MSAAKLSPADQVRAALRELAAHYGTSGYHAMIAYLEAQEKCLMQSLLAASTHDETNITRGRIREIQSLKSALMDMGKEGPDQAESDTDY